ncbi:S-layer homology domain-containing protein [Paenalkalicoccus suaedae]|uniref:S-layer homology domain-containing protein n=1 Tax=Paenalkalicoccus suaedae TaxID=2592382 RepID=A0A859FJ78_9BACI|nr:S-layer homology domain-containing protein [Paenalkalicoccus suaedae]QKS72616.1 S-layer homology domain-containing protein [Paenalkalicoccus suaedae]
MKTAMRLLLASVLILSLFATPASAANFSDMKQGDFGHSEVTALVEKSIIGGMPNGTFAPRANVSRADTAIMFTRALGLTRTSSNNPFRDTDRAAYYFNDAMAAVDAGIFTGDALQRFNPRDTLTREQMASVIVRAYNLQPTSTQVSLNDLNAVHQAHIDDVRTLAQNGITAGRANGNYDPKAPVTRVEFAIFLDRTIKQNPDVGAPTPTPEQPGTPEQPAPTPDPEDPTNPEDPVDGPEPTPPGGGGGAPAPSEPSVITAASLTTANGTTITGSVSNGTTVRFNLSNLPDSTTFRSGTISVTEAATLTTFDGPVADLDVTQQLKAGENNLTVAEVLGNAQIQLGTIRLFGDFTLPGTLTSNGQTTNVQVIFQF